MANRRLEGLFDAEFIESVQRLRLLAKRVARSGRPAEQRSRDLGSGIEFRDFRAYSPGDDFRAIDWNIYRRLGRVFLRLFEELEDLPVYLAVDVSESMFLEDPPRAYGGLRSALALAAIALNQHDSVGLFPFSDKLTTALRPTSGKNRLFQFVEALSSLEPGGRTDFKASLNQLAHMKLRNGMLVVVSDFFDAGGVESVIQALSPMRHRLLLLQLCRTTDRDPGLNGDVRLRDCETGDAEDISVTPAVLTAYQAAYDRFQQGLSNFAKSRDAGLLRVDTDADVLSQLATLFESGSLVV